MFKLNVTKATFEKNLLNSDFEYRVINYDDFISTIRQLIFFKLKRAIEEDNFKETLFLIFNKKNIDLLSPLIISDMDEITFIDKDYFFSLVSESNLYIFLKNKNVREIPEYLFESVYIFNKINSLNLPSNIEGFLKKEFLSNVSLDSVYFKRAYNIKDALSQTKIDAINNNLLNHIKKIITEMFFLKVDFFLNAGISYSEKSKRLNIVESKYIKDKLSTLLLYDNISVFFQDTVSSDLANSFSFRMHQYKNFPQYVNIDRKHHILLSFKSELNEKEARELKVIENHLKRSGDTYFYQGMRLDTLNTDDIFSNIDFIIKFDKRRIVLNIQEYINSIPVELS